MAPLDEDALDDDAPDEIARPDAAQDEPDAAPARPARGASGPAPLDATSAKKPHVLIVDDDPDVLDALCDALKHEGYSVRGARDGIEALESIEERRPDLVITDLMMPTMTGWELLGALHDDPELSTIPTLIITAARAPVAPKASAGIFNKPLDLDGLLRAINAFTGPGEGGGGRN